MGATRNGKRLVATIRCRQRPPLRNRFSASPIWAVVIFAATISRFFVANEFLPLAAKLNHTCALTKSCGRPRRFPYMNPSSF